MNLQITKFKFTEKIAAKVGFNYEEIKAFLNDSLADYANAVVTEDTVKDAKKTCADLNKLAKVIDDERKTTKKELESPIKTFESQMKELYSSVKDAREKIDSQVKFFEDAKKEENKEIALALIDQTAHEIELWDKYREQVELKDEYMNLSTNPTKVKADIVEQFQRLKMMQDQEQQKIDTIKIIVDTYNDQLEFKFDSKEFDYLLDNDIQTISSVVKQKVLGRIEQEKLTRERLEQEKLEAIRLAEERVKREAEEKAERLAKENEAKRQEEIQRAEMKRTTEIAQAELEQRLALEAINESIDKIIPVEETEEVQEVEFRFEVKGTPGKMEALRNYLNQYDYEWSELF